jgi:hypothetical protein
MVTALCCLEIAVHPNTSDEEISRVERQLAEFQTAYGRTPGSARRE